MLTNQRPQYLNYHSHLLIKARMQPVTQAPSYPPSPHLQRKASVIASHTNQHNLCNYALKVTLGRPESDVSGPDSGGRGGESEGGRERKGEREPALITPGTSLSLSLSLSL